MTTHTETTQETTELIRSIDYNTGWSYSVSGHGVEPTSGEISVPSKPPRSRSTPRQKQDGRSSTCPANQAGRYRHQVKAFNSSSPIRDPASATSRDRSNHGNQKRYRYHKYLSALIGLSALGSPALANTVGGVSATANPIAQSSSSVQNQAIQVLQGPYISSKTGTTQCQGPTLNITPFVTHSLGFQKPYEDIYYTPVYNEVDLEGGFDADGNPIPDGIPDAGWGDVAFHKPVRTARR